jgi:hypothetical protein
LIVDVLFRRNYDGILLRCVDEKRAQELMQEFHGGICGGHFAPTATTHKIIRDGFYWPSIFKDSYATVRKCISCQQFSGKMKKYAMPLQPIYVEQPFSQWGLDVIGPINPKSSKGNIYILTATDYFTKWKEAVALKRVDSEELIKFLKDNILSRFGVPEKFISDNGSIFIGSKFTEFCGEYGIVMGQSSNYYPQGNGLVESTNKTLIQILKKTIDQNQKNWHLKLTDALWASIMTLKDSTGMSLYMLVYGKEEKIPISLELNALTYAVNTEDAEDSTPMQKRLNQLLKLEEERSEALHRTSQRQQSVKKYFDQSATVKNFQKGELVLLWNKAKEKPSMHTKFEALWIGSYIIENIMGFNSYMLKDMKGKMLMFHVNGRHLKIFFC